MNLSVVKVIVADDNPLQLSYLIELVERLRPSWEIVSRATTSSEVEIAFENLSPTLAILNIKFPDTTAIEIIHNLGDICPVVLVTDDPLYAAEAFTCNALDFLLKPLKVERLEQALMKAEAFMVSKNKFHHSTQTTPKSLRMFRGHELVWAELDDVCYFQAEGKYTRVVMRDQEGLLKMGIASTVQFLNSQTFWRIHRGLVLNMHQMSSAKRDEFGRMTIKLAARAEKLIVSKPYEHLFRDGFS